MKAFFSTNYKNHTFRFILSLTICLTVSAFAVTAAPSNDNFADAQLLNGLGNNGELLVTTGGATREANEPIHAKNRGGASIWYKYVAPNDGVFWFSTVGSSFDTLLAVYKGGNLNDLKFIGASDDFNGSDGGKVFVAAHTNDVFYIAIDGKNNINSAAETGNAFIHYNFQNSVGNDNFANADTLFELGRKRVVTNINATKEAGEPTISGNAGGKSVWYKWTAPAGITKSYTFTLESRNLDGTASVDGLFGIYTGSSVNNLSAVKTYQAFDEVNKLHLVATPGTTYYIMIDGYDFADGEGARIGTFTLDFNITKSGKESDFDRDGKVDLTVFRPSNGTWYTLDSITDNLRAVQFGENGDKPMLIDFRGDGVLDYTLFRPSNGMWFTKSNDFIRTFNFGVNGDTALLNESQTIAFIEIFRPSTGDWWEANNAGTLLKTVHFGLSGDIPIQANFSGNGLDDRTVFRPSNGTWFIQSGSSYKAVKFGINGDKPVPADYDGDGKADIAVYRPSTGTWWVLRSSDGSAFAVNFGIATDIPQPADFDGDGKDDIAIYRDGTWWILQSSNIAVRVAQFGLAGDIPVSAPLF